MKAVLIMSSLFLASYSFAQDVYTFDCASDQGYIVVRIDADRFNSQLKRAPGEIDIHSDNGSEEFSDAYISNRVLNRSNGFFRFAVSMGRSGSASIRGNFFNQTGAFSAKTIKHHLNSSDAVCRFDNGLEGEE